jgi:hemoglobin/transferrin/lactoferrin receptor protein
MNGRFGVRYSYPKLGSVELTLVGAAKQDKVSDGESETGGYTRLDLAVNLAKST